MFVINATDYAPVTPVTPPCDIIPIFIGYKGENKARCLVFDLTDCIEEFGEGGFAISFLRHGDAQPYIVTDTDQLDYTAIWEINSTDTAVEGYGMVQLQYIVGETVCKTAMYRTVTFDSNESAGDVPDPYENLLDQIAAYAATAEGAASTATAAAATASTAVANGIALEKSQRIAADENLQTQITSLMGLAGAPAMANTAAAMTDNTKVYVYTGNEVGYTFGDWYYYDGAQWVSGGVYQATAVQTDKTLTVSDMAADAAVVGEKIDECMAAFVTDTASGSIASFSDGADGVPLKDLVVNINPVQSGTGDPSPSNPRPITGWTQAKVTRTGKNLLDISQFATLYPSYCSFSNGVLSVNASNTSASVLYSDGIPVSIAHPSVLTYTITNGTSANARIRLKFSDGTAASVYPNNLPYTANKDIIAVCFDWGTRGTFTVNEAQIEFGTSATTFEPFGSTYNITFPDAAGTVYGGTLDVTTGMLTMTWNAWNMGRFTYGYNADSQYFYTSIGDKSPGNHNVISSIYKTTSATSVTQMTDFEIKGHASNYTIYIKDSRYTDGATLKSALEGQMFAAELSNPVSYQLTPTEVKSLLANNNIWSDTGSVSSCEYRADTKLYLEKLTTPDDDMVANANITSGSYFMVGNSLYLATANIANGGAITPGTNCTATNLAAALNAINS